MTRGDLINKSGAVPAIAGRRINMFDVMAALESPNPESQLYEDWNLSEEEVEAALTYVRQHREELREMLADQTPT